MSTMAFRAIKFSGFRHHAVVPVYGFDFFFLSSSGIVQPVGMDTVPDTTVLIGNSGPCDPKGELT